VAIGHVIPSRSCLTYGEQGAPSFRGSCLAYGETRPRNLPAQDERLVSVTLWRSRLRLRLHDCVTVSVAHTLLADSSVAALAALRRLLGMTCARPTPHSPLRTQNSPTISAPLRLPSAWNVNRSISLPTKRTDPSAIIVNTPPWWRLRV